MVGVSQFASLLGTTGFILTQNGETKMALMEGVVTGIVTNFITSAISGSAKAVTDKLIGSITFGDDNTQARLNIELEPRMPDQSFVFDWTEKQIGEFNFKFFLSRFGAWNRDFLQGDIVITIKAFIVGPLCVKCKTSVSNMEYKERKIRGDIFYCKDCKSKYWPKSVESATKDAATWFEEVIPKVLQLD